MTNASPSREALADTVRSAFVGAIEPVKITAGYRLGILLAAAAMVALPIVYIGLIIGVVWLMCWHATHNVTLASGGAGGRGAIRSALALYIGPLIAGCVLVLFLLKPLFARPAKRSKPRTLSRSREPLLFEFVDGICAAVGAPRPRRVCVDCDVNASASFRRGMLSMLGQDLELTIGLPLVAGLDARQLAGVIAHEFGHFTQGAGMRLTYIVRTIGYWFTRVVYERDAWDERLASMAGLGSWPGLLVLITRFFIFLTRRVLWCLMMVGHAVAGFMLRQMEFHADLHECRLAGSEVFEQTSHRMRILGWASQGAYADLVDFYREGRLGDNLPQLILANVAQLPAELLEKVDAQIDREKSSWLDTHPSDRERIAAAKADAASGVFQLDLPATELFADFDSLARQCTLDFYRRTIGLEFKPTSVQAVSELLDRQEKDKTATAALDRFTQRSFSVERLLHPPTAAATAQHASAESLRQSREGMLAALPAHLAAIEEWRHRDRNRTAALRNSALLEAGLQAEPAKPGAANVVQTAAARSQNADALDEFETALSARMFAALSCVQNPEVVARAGLAAADLEEIERLSQAARDLVPSMSMLLELRDSQIEAGALIERLEAMREDNRFVDVLQKKLRASGRLLQAIFDEARDLPYPFEHGAGQVAIRGYLMDKRPEADDYDGVLAACSTTFDRLPSLYVRVWARLAQFAERMEDALGLARLPEPAPEEASAATNSEA